MATSLPFGTVDTVLGGGESHLWAVSEPFWCVLAMQLLGGAGSVGAVRDPRIPRSRGLSHCL